jgi:hypothetical protein
MTSSSWGAFDSKQLREQLRDDSDSFREFSQDSVTDILDRIYPDAEISGLDLSDSCKSDNGQASRNIGGDVAVNDSGSGYNDEDDENEDWAL